MTQVTEVRLERLVIPFAVPIVTASGTWRERRLALVRLINRDGAEGVGEVATAEPAGLVDVGLESSLTALVGLDPLDETASDAIVERIRFASTALASAVDAAAWDLRARGNGLPLARALGRPTRESVRLNGLVGAERPDDAAASARVLVDSGFECLKVKARDEPPEVVAARLAAIRDAVGEAVDLRVDFNGALDLGSAGRILPELVPYRIEYVEDPLPSVAGVAALAALRRESPIELAADETVANPAAAVALLGADAVDVLVVKPARVGGISTTKEIIAAATRAGIRVVLSTLFESGVGLAGALHLAATLRGVEVAHGLATADLLLSDLLLRPLPIVRGRMIVPPGHGLGVELDPAALKRFAIR